MRLVECYAKPTDWHNFKINITSTFQRAVHPMIHFVLNYRYKTYQPFLIDRWEDICPYLEGAESSAEVFNVFHQSIENYTSLHSCPFEKGESLKIASEEIDVEQFWCDALPNGEYRLDTTIITPNDKIMIMTIEIYFSILDDGVWY